MSFELLFIPSPTKLRRDIVTLPSVPPSHPCEHSRINILQWILTKPGIRLEIFYIMFIGNIVNIVQHSHLYNSFLLIIVACIVILLVAILPVYRDHVGFWVIVTFSSIHKLKWPVLLSYLREWNQNWTELTHVWHTKFLPGTLM